MWRGVLIWMNHWERYRTEVLTSLASLWAAKSLLLAPSNFESRPFRFHLVAEISSSEVFWGWFALIAALLKLVGLLCCLRYQSHNLGLSLRVAGLSMSGFFWTAVGLSATIGNFDNITGTPMVLVGFAAWWLLFLFPAMPERT